MRSWRYRSRNGSALENSRILIHQPSTQGSQGQSSDLEIQAREILRMRALMETMLVRATGRDAAEIRRDVERDTIFSAAQAKDYGLIDEVVASRKSSTLATLAVAST